VKGFRTRHPDLQDLLLGSNPAISLRGPICAPPTPDASTAVYDPPIRPPRRQEGRWRDGHSSDVLHLLCTRRPPSRCRPSLCACICPRYTSPCAISTATGSTSTSGRPADLLSQVPSPYNLLGDGNLSDDMGTLVCDVCADFV
jgi:hypothetical protein